MKGGHVFCYSFFGGLKFLISNLNWDGKNAQLWGIWFHQFEAYRFFLYMFGFSRMGLGSHIVLRGTIRDVMKGCRGFRAIFSVMWLGNNALGWKYFGLVSRREYLLKQDLQSEELLLVFIVVRWCVGEC